METRGRIQGPYEVVSVASDCKYTLKLKADQKLRSGVSEGDLRVRDT